MFMEFLAEQDLFSMLRPGLPYPSGETRSPWLAVPNRASLLRDTEESLVEPYPQLRATDFLQYLRTGSRKAYENPYFQRRRLLISAVVGECLAWEGRYVDRVVDGLWLLAEETSWVVSTHNVDDHPGRVPPGARPLPDKGNPVIDLFAAQSAATVTLSCHLLAGPLDAVSPMIRQRMRDEVSQRVLKPFMERDDFWWMGFIRQDVNNWTPWILSNILLCLLYWERDPYRLAQGTSRAMQMLEKYLAVMPMDGGCDEGAGYWNLSGAALLDCLELLHHATGGQANFYNVPHIHAIASFPLYAHIDGPYYWNFADCDAKPHLDGERMWTFGIRTGVPALAQLGQRVAATQHKPWTVDTPEMSRVLDKLLANMPPEDEADDSQPADGTVVLPDLQVWACRKGPYYAALKGGHNGENHNHNDVGSFLLYLHGKPAIVDAGNMTYTATTFSSQRYRQWNTPSCNHNVPLVGGQQQCPGPEYRARVLALGEEGMRLELRDAYPEACGIISYVRSSRMEDGFHLLDTLLLEKAAVVEWIFLLREEPAIETGGCLAGPLRLRFPPGMHAQALPYPVTDPRMAQNHPGTLWRLSITAAPSKEHTVEFVMEVHV